MKALTASVGILTTTALIGAAAACKSRSFHESSGTKTMWPSASTKAKSLQPLPSWWPAGTETSFSSLDDEKEFYDTLEKNFTPGQLKEDWRFASLLFALVQPPLDGTKSISTDTELSGELGKAPKSYLELVQWVTQKQLSLRDWHTSVTLTPANHRTSVLPVVTKCTGHPSCGLILGTRIEPLPSEVEKRVYAYVPRTGKTRVFRPTGDVIPEFSFLKFLEMNGSTPWNTMRDVVEKSPASEIVSGNYVSFSGNFLTRSVVYRNERDPLPVLVSDVTFPASKMELELSYTAGAAQRKPLPEFGNHPRGKVFPQRSYGCRTVHPGSTFELGACVNTDSRALLWIQTFVPNAAGVKGRDIVAFVDEFLTSLGSAHAHPVVVDLRANGGGDLGVAQRLACLLGGARVRTALENLDWHRTVWPARFELDSLVVNSADILGMRKMDVDASWEVSVAAPTAMRRTTKVDSTVFLPGGLSGCDSLSGKTADKLKYVLVAGGNEFSATESFLHLMSKVEGRVKIVGTTSRGGTGNPIQVSLPHTSLTLRLSRQRQFDRENNTWIIEGRGVRQDVRWPRDFEADFERRITDGYLGDRDLEAFEYAPMVLRKALELSF